MFPGSRSRREMLIKAAYGKIRQRKEYLSRSHRYTLHVIFTLAENLNNHYHAYLLIFSR